MRTLAIASTLLLSTMAWAGRGGSTALIESAISSGSADTIVAELERAEFLVSTSSITAVRALVDYPSDRVREAAGWWLTRRGTRDEILASMTARLAGQDPVAARNAADVLRGVRDISALPALTTYIANPLDEESGVAAARAIGVLGHPKSVTALQGAFGSSLAGVRAAALTAMRELRAPIGQSVVSNASAVIPLVSDGDANVRRQAAITAGYLRDAAAVPALSNALASDTQATVRKAAAWALGQIGDGSARTALTTAQSDGDALVRSVATAALGRLK